MSQRAPRRTLWFWVLAAALAVYVLQALVGIAGGVYVALRLHGLAP